MKPGDCFLVLRTPRKDTKAPKGRRYSPCGSPQGEQGIPSRIALEEGSPLGSFLSLRMTNRGMPGDCFLVLRTPRKDSNTSTEVDVRRQPEGGIHSIPYHARRLLPLDFARGRLSSFGLLAMTQKPRRGAIISPVIYGRADE